MSARPRGTDSARIIPVIETTALIGTGDSENDKCRIIRQYWSMQGELLAENDPCKDTKNK